MFLSILKYLLLTAVILLVGQIPLGGSTLGGTFAAQVGEACQWSGEQVRSSKMLAGVGDFSFVERWWKSAVPKRKHAATRKEIVERTLESKSDGKDSDGVSQADREALIRLLQ